MKLQEIFPTMRSFLVACLLVGMTGCADLMNDSYPGGSYGGDPYYGGSYRNDDDYYRRREWERTRRERRDLERERDQVEEERRRLDEERNRNTYRPPPPAQDRCPSGFSPSEQKCSPEERRRGCKDMRLPSGLGCVRR